MQITINITKATTKRLLLLGGLFFVGLAATAVYGVPVTFDNGTVLTAEQLNQNFSNLETRLAAIEGQQRVERATISATGTVTQSGSWILSVSRTGDGAYVINFSPGVFSSTPSCVATATAGNQIAPSVECYNVSQNGTSCVATVASGPVNVGIMLICVGTK